MTDEHANELRRCLLELDVDGMRRLHSMLWPHFPQPRTRDECLCSMHAARLQLRCIHPDAKRYSQEWLSERQGPVAKAVGVAVMSLSRSSTPARAANVQSAMLAAVDAAIKEGVDIDSEAHEVRRRIEEARKKERGGQPLIGWQFEQPNISVKW